ncbi:PF12266 domain protein [Bordetella pertussis STO1-SEAT-0007]|nr:PF12266 domain protein [Bordetella pertussis STO1-SEAT-0007]
MRGAGRPGRRRRGADPSSLDRGARGPGQPGAGRRTAGGAPGRRAGRAPAQADGRRAGPGLPLQGPVASAAWQRYLESFSQPIPQWFGERIEDNVGGSGGGGG